MKKTIFSLVTAATIAGSFSLGSNASAAEVTVKKGDTLWDLAKVNNISVEELKDWNNLTTDIIHPADQLKVALAELYEINRGDTLSGIAKKYDGVSAQQIAEWNMLENPNLIYPGETLAIYVKGNTNPVLPDVQEEEPVVVDAVEEAPVEAPVTEAPAEEPVTEAPAEEPVTEAPAEEPVTEAPAEEPVTAAPAEEAPANEEVVQELTVTATAYTAYCEGCSGITATGINLIENPHLKVVAVDPNVIPLGSKIWIEGYGDAIAGDTGGAIKGNKIDLFIPNRQDALNFGVQEVRIKVYN
ncbi:LysM peptidoglycan-binding domain-containing protein [Sutcliffiella deserti]|uniref:LysM peptidoglycan-binding domain-containing protein n=1 Tax=Sutcliffiella deserti TaxID=2875501 RepID=UPI00295AE402|nr:LysM peptidoglycan-binding domain-containing protein [Sutcliffiella deserti]